MTPFIIDDLSATRFSAGDQGHGSYGIYVGTNVTSAAQRAARVCGSLLMYCDREELHEALKAGQNASEEHPVVIPCRCGDPKCTSQASFQGPIVVVSRKDVQITATIGPVMYQRCITGTRAAYEDARAAAEAAVAAAQRIQYEE